MDSNLKPEIAVQPERRHLAGRRLSSKARRCQAMRRLKRILKARAARMSVIAALNGLAGKMPALRLNRFCRRL